MVINIRTIKEVKDKIGFVCQRHRKINDLSRDELAEALDISSTTIQNIENGKNANLDNMLKIANHFNLLSNIYDSLEGFSEADNNPSLY